MLKKYTPNVFSINKCAIENMMCVEQKRRLLKLKSFLIEKPNTEIVWAALLYLVDKYSISLQKYFDNCVCVCVRVL